MKGLDAHWTDATEWLVYTLLGMLGPVAFSAFLILAQDKPLSLGGFTNGGQFAIYSLAMWITTYRLILRQSPVPIPFHRFLGFILFLGILFSFAIFTVGSLYSHSVAVQPDYVQLPSIGAFVVSSVVSFVIVALDSQRTELDLREERSEDLAQLKQELGAVQESDS